MFSGGADLEGQLRSKKCPTRGADLEGQLRSKKCPVASTYKINIQTPFWHQQSTCWSFWHRLIRPNTMTTSGSAANSTATTPVPYRQRLNSPNVKSTSGWTAVCSQFVGRGAMLSYNSPSLNFSTTLDQRRQKFLDGRRQPRYKFL